MPSDLSDLILAWKTGNHVEWSRLWGELTPEQRAEWEAKHGG